jgi:hypothetical protein
MAIDDPLDASEQQLAAERQASSPLSRLIPYVSELGTIISVIVPGTGLAIPPLKALALRLSMLEARRCEYLMTTLSDELRRVRANLEHLTESHRRFIEEEYFPLVVDGLQKAEQTRSTQRIRRIAAILAHAYEAGPTKSADLAEELMRIAMLLSDDDVVVLRGLYDGQKAGYNSQAGRTSAEQANDFWRLIDPIHGTALGPETSLHRFPIGVLQGICGKLQSMGLVVQVQRNDFKVSQSILPYAILARAVDFVEYIQNSIH